MLQRSLQDDILDSGKGLILSEQPLGVKATPGKLVARNRLQAALSNEVIVVQCPEKSGTMHTVRFAQRYGKSILAYDFGRFTPESSGNQYILTSGLGQPIKL